jgi:hypothetical protein
VSLLDLKCDICKKDTGDNIESHTIQISITRTDLDLDLSVVNLTGDHRDFLICTNPWCRISLLMQFIEEAEMEIPKNKPGGG